MPYNLTHISLPTYATESAQHFYCQFSLLPNSRNLAMSLPTYTQAFHNSSYSAISPARPEVSTAGKVILITGGGLGIGRRTSHAFVTSGSTKIAIIGRTEASLLSTKVEIEAEHLGVKVLTFVADIVDRGAVVGSLLPESLILKSKKEQCCPFKTTSSRESPRTNSIFTLSSTPL